MPTKLKVLLLLEAMRGPLLSAPQAAAAALGSVAAASSSSAAAAGGYGEQAGEEAAADATEEAAAAEAAERYAVAWHEVASSHADDVRTCAAYRRQCLHPELFEGRVRTEWLAPSFARLFADGPPSVESIRALVEEVSPGIFVFDFLAPAFCAMLLCELEHYESSGLPVVRPNSMCGWPR